MRKGCEDLKEEYDRFFTQIKTLIDTPSDVRSIARMLYAMKDIDNEEEMRNEAIRIVGEIRRQHKNRDLSNTTASQLGELAEVAVEVCMVGIEVLPPIADDKSANRTLH